MDQSKLVEGCIPAGQQCPWWEDCEYRQVTCPNPLGKRAKPFSCAAARAFEIVDKTGNKVLKEMLKK